MFYRNIKQTRLVRKIIHCDCDCFYASVEMRDDPELTQLPLAIGGSPQKRGVVATCNYPARRFGIHSAMPMSQAVRACPNLTILPPDMKKYRKESLRIREIFLHYTKKIEPLSLDEAFLDVSDLKIAGGSATRIAAEIRQRVHDEVGVTISAGIAPNKFLAKIASDWHKPDGQFTITPKEAQDFIDKLPINKIFGVGKVTEKKMRSRGIEVCSDLKQIPLSDLINHYGKFGTRLYELCRGIDNRPVSTNRKRKSISSERTFSLDLNNKTDYKNHLVQIVEDLERRVINSGYHHKIRRLNIKIRFSNFKITTASRSHEKIDKDLFVNLFFKAWERHALPVRLIGAGVDIDNTDQSLQTELF